MANQRVFARSVYNIVKARNQKSLDKITRIYKGEALALKEYLYKMTPKRTGGLARYGTYSEIHENPGVSISIVVGYSNGPHISLGKDKEPARVDKITNIDLATKLSEPGSRRYYQMEDIRDRIDTTLINIKERVKKVMENEK